VCGVREAGAVCRAANTAAWVRRCLPSLAGMPVT
jgi:hypothetical protein